MLSLPVNLHPFALQLDTCTHNIVKSSDRFFDPEFVQDDATRYPATFPEFVKYGLAILTEPYHVLFLKHFRFTVVLSVGEGEGGLHGVSSFLVEQSTPALVADSGGVHLLRCYFNVILIVDVDDLTGGTTS